jgi:rhodanese-related sulfurtransferase
MSFLSTLFGKKDQEITGNITELNKNEYATQIVTNNIKPFDVRTPSEFHSGHIKKAINVDIFNAGNFNSYFEKLDKDKPVYLYCRSGARSQKAARKLLKMGFAQVYDLKGGYNSWN